MGGSELRMGRRARWLRLLAVVFVILLPALSYGLYTLLTASPGEIRIAVGPASGRHGSTSPTRWRRAARW